MIAQASLNVTVTPWLA